MDNNKLTKITLLSASNGAAVTYIALLLAKLICTECDDIALDALAAAIASLLAGLVRIVKEKVLPKYLQ